MDGMQWIRWLAAVLVVGGTAAGALAESPPKDSDLYRHPLCKAGEVDGKLLAFDLKNASDGSRYAVEESVVMAEGGEKVHQSGLAKLERRPLSAEEAELYRWEKEMERDPLEDDVVQKSATKIGEALEEALATAAETELLDVLVRLERPAEEPLFVQLERLVALGVIETKHDYESSRANLLAARRETVRQAQDPIVSLIEQLGGEVLHRCENMLCLAARLRPAAVRELAAREAVSRLDLDTEITEEADIMGDLIIRGTQIRQLIDSGYDGENGISTDVTFGVVEVNGFNDEHRGYRDGTGTSARIRGRYSCSTTSCSAIGDFGAPTSDHPMGVSGIIFGDLRDGQDPGVTNSTDRINRSGYAGEANGFLYDAENPSTSWQRAFDSLIGRNPVPRVVNMSLGDGANDPACRGESSLSRDANDLFESGILLFKSAGNTGHASTSDCTVTAPGSAIGVFTVGGHGTSTTGTETSVRSGNIYGDTARGGASSAEGKSRTIIDLTAYAHRRRMLDRNGGYGYASSGTSFAAPTVTAGAIDFIDFYKRTYSNLIDNPGILFANLLLMGDRQGESSKLTSGYSNLWGAGRFKMRKWDAAGLDAPTEWKTGYTCVEQGETVTVTVNSGNTLSTAVDDFKAVIFWYDRRHETGGTIDDIDLVLKTTAGGILRSSLSFFDNKERVYYSGIGGKAVKLEIHGFNVTADNEGCGTNSMRVYYAMFYEDDARNDSDGPGTSIDPE